MQKIASSARPISLRFKHLIEFGMLLQSYSIRLLDIEHLSSESIYWEEFAWVLAHLASRVQSYSIVAFFKGLLRSIRVTVCSDVTQ